MLDNSKEENIKLKLHLKYIVFISLLIITCLSIFACFLWPYNENIAQKLSFAGTVSSIILSVLAIIVTLLGESKSENTREKIDVSTTQLEDATLKIKNSTNELINKIYLIEELKDNMSQRFDTLEYIVEKNTDNFSNKSTANDIDKIVGLFQARIDSKTGREFTLISKYMYNVLETGKSMINLSVIEDAFREFAYKTKDIRIIFGMCVVFVSVQDEYKDKFIEKLNKKIELENLENNLNYILELHKSRPYLKQE